MDISTFLNGIDKLHIDYFTGVPDSRLSPLCNALYARYGLEGSHMVAANEGGAVGLAAGHYIGTGRPALVYLQNSGLGNIVNPVASLLSDKVYGIPCLFVVGWRGEPGLHDEPQHAFQGEVTLEQLELMKIQPYVLTKETTEAEFADMLAAVKQRLEQRRLCAFVARDGALKNPEKPAYPGKGTLKRERALELLLCGLPGDAVFVSTTGKTSREVFELREKHGMGHAHDFLTVGSMGHANMIAMGVAQARPERRVYCLDGDGALLMHMGSLAVEAVRALPNYVHVLLNNGAHESVGGMPVAEGKPCYQAIAKACGYARCLHAANEEQLRALLPQLGEGACFVEIELAQGSRPELGRPTTTPKQNLSDLMQYLRGETK